ncbi:MAG TPA: phytoene/squalene synthase family protein [Gemmatimonadaceae bacterium]|nr:phytoene/squalene synthase family protein [Gemmatimonadaceae bacterium]
MPARANVREAERFCNEILPAVSRTFAISIRLLPGQLGRSVLAAYLLCRIADTIEDDQALPAEQRAAMFDAMLAAFTDAARAEAFVAAAVPVTGDAAHVELVHRAADVFALWRDLPPGSGAHVKKWVEEMVRGMRKIVLEHPHGVRLRTLAAYHEYCYYVAGTVGFMLTDLWREHSHAIDDRTYAALQQKARAFGEALQTVNILKDVAHDAERENNIYIPDELLRSHGSSHATMLDPQYETANHAALSTLITLAWKNLDDARDYLLLVPRRALAVRLFCILPLLYAYATLRDLTRSRAMLRPGGNVKISRREVRTLMFAGILSVPSNAAVGWLVARVRKAN